MSGSLAAIDRYLGERGVAQWLVGKRMTQADITAVCGFTFLDDTLLERTFDELTDVAPSSSRRGGV
jgi:hypothetical protein